MKSVKAGDVVRSWHLIDAKNKILGRLASDIAKLLMGKNKTYYTPYLDTGDYVVVINTKDVALSGKKETQKKYWHHSQYPGGLKSKTAKVSRAENPERLLRHAVTGMIPKTKIFKIILQKTFRFCKQQSSIC